MAVPPLRGAENPQLPHAGPRVVGALDPSAEREAEKNEDGDGNDSHDYDESRTREAAVRCDRRGSRSVVGERFTRGLVELLIRCLLRSAEPIRYARHASTSAR